MNVFVRAQPAPKPRTDSAQQMALFYAAFLSLMVVTQLFTFELFTELIASFDLPIGAGGVAALPALIVVFELFSLPFLLRMAVSPAFRWVSMVCCWLVSVVWLGISLWVVTSAPFVENIGFFGTVVDLVPGWWAVLISLLFAVKAAWASWGLLPARAAKKNA